MAQIDLETLKKIKKDRNTVQAKVKATYSVFVDNENRKYLQIDTYGKESRASEPKVSQSFQIDKETAHFLVELLAKEFDLTFRIS